MQMARKCMKNICVKAVDRHDSRKLSVKRDVIINNVNLKMKRDLKMRGLHFCQIRIMIS